MIPQQLISKLSFIMKNGVPHSQGQAKRVSMSTWQINERSHATKLQFMRPVCKTATASHDHSNRGKWHTRNHNGYGTFAKDVLQIVDSPTKMILVSYLLI